MAWIDGSKKPDVHMPAAGVEYSTKTTRWYELRGEVPPVGTPRPGEVPNPVKRKPE